MVYTKARRIYSCKWSNLQAKARAINQQLQKLRKEPNSFTASAGWAWRFCQRHRMRESSLQGEKLSADQPAATKFILDFNGFVKDCGYSLAQICNCDETGLYYKLLPQRFLVAHFEKSADGRKTQKERVTISACSNALGPIKLPLLLNGKYKNPRCLSGISRETLPVIYVNQKNAWVDTVILTSWFHKNFVPYVKNKLSEMSIDPRAVFYLIIAQLIQMKKI